MSKRNSKVSLFRATIKTFEYSFKSWPIAFTVYLLITLANGMLYGLAPLVMQNAFEAVTEMTLGLRLIRGTIFPLMLFISFSVGRDVFITIWYLYMTAIYDRAHGFICKQIAIKTAKIDPILFEDPNVLDDIYRALNASYTVFGVTNIMTITFIQNVPYILIMSIYLFTLNPLLILVIVLSFAPKILSLFIRAKLYTELEEKSAPLKRESNFYEEAMVDRQYFKETRLLGIFDFFKEKYLKTVRLLNRETWKADSRAATFDLVIEILTAFSFFGILYLLFISLQDGNITVGAFAAVLASVNQLSINIDFMIKGLFAKIAEDVGKITCLIEFLNLPEKTGVEVEINWAGDIEFKNVHFAYPNAQKESLKGLSLTIKAGKTIAIVGDNGAGKSTFAQLLMGLYEPTSGEITVDGVNIRNIKSKQLFSKVSAIFQQYQCYQLMLKENIQISNVDTEQDIIPAMKEAGVEWESKSYPNGVDTVLSREFDGVDLSGGQWQKISIARGLYRYHDLIVLDEPTAAIDPLEESKLYKKFAEISKDKTAIIVTHRLGSAKMADQIIVLDEGQVVEVGTHQELLESKGYYAKMYESQASWYMS